MSEETEVIEPGEAPETAAAPEQPPEAASAEPNWEDRALAMGWTPKSQFKGDPEKWVDAETFVKRGEEFLPFLKANNRRLEQALERANTKMASLEKAVSESVKHISRAEQRAYERAKAELEAELEYAASQGDAERVKAVNKDIVDLEREVSGKSDRAEPEPSPDFEAWREDNDWYGKDKALSAAFDALCEEVYEDGYTKPKAGLKEATNRLRERFPEKFAKAENPNRRAPAPVEGVTATRPRGKTYADLPPDAKQMCDEFCRDIKGFTREKFVKDYFAEDKK